MKKGFLPSLHEGFVCANLDSQVLSVVNGARDIGRPRGYVASESPWWVKDRNVMPLEPMWEFH